MDPQHWFALFTTITLTKRAACPQVTALHTTVSMGRKVTLGVAKLANTSCSVENSVSVELTKKLLSCIPLFLWAGGYTGRGKAGKHIVERGEWRLS
jgi:hypothetical protein